MIDLHVHFDGSIRPQTLLELMTEMETDLLTDEIKQLESYIRKPDYDLDLNVFAKRLDIAFAVLQDRRTIRRVMYELVRDLDDQGVFYAEIHLAPQYHVLRGLTQQQVVEAAYAGLERAVSDSRRVRANLMLCTVKGADEKDNFSTIVEAGRLLRRGVAGIYLMGDEKQAPIETYQGQFQMLNEEGIPFSVHAGMDAGPDSIALAIECGARRIGHGLRAVESEDVMQLIKERGIVLEMCPMSNIRKGIVKSLKDHPIRTYFEKGLKVTVNTDDMMIDKTNLALEYRMLEKELGFTKEDIQQLMRNAVDGAFVAAMQKERLKMLLGEI